MAREALPVIPGNYYVFTYWQLAFQLERSGMALTILLECEEIRWIEVPDEQVSPLSLVST